MLKSSALSVLLVRYKIIGVPALADPRHTSRTKFGEWWVPNSRLKMSMQRWPHGGVAADAVSAPALASPPASASVAAAATNLLLMDITWFLLATCGGAPCTAAEPGLTRTRGG